MDPISLLQAPQGALPPGQATQPTPVEIQNMYEYARSLQNNRLPVRSWPAGVSNMLNSLMGGLAQNQAAGMGRIPQAIEQQQPYKMPPNPGNLAPAPHDNA